MPSPVSYQMVTNNDATLLKHQSDASCKLIGWPGSLTEGIAYLAQGEDTGGRKRRRNSDRKRNARLNYRSDRAGPRIPPTDEV
jgi:hypothetical protein